MYFISGKIELTKRKDLESLMSLEFHKKDGSYDSYEPKNFLIRLSKNENLKNLLLRGMVKPEILTALIIFGDGFIERPIGGGSVYPKDKALQDVMRPNASLSLFFKDDMGNVKLVFYSRFLSINYSHSSDIGNQIRDECKKLDSETDQKKKKIITDKIFLLMSDLDEIKLMKSVNEAPKKSDRYHFALKSWKSARMKDLGDRNNVNSIGVPWIRLWDKNKKEPRIIQLHPYKKVNTIHGAHDTERCWMFLRNFLWNWPNEDINQHQDYTKLAKAYLSNRERDRYSNYTYFTFLRYFTGLKYTKHSDAIMFPKQIYKVVNDGKNNKKTFKTNLIEEVDNFWEGEYLKYKNGFISRVKHYDGRSKFIILEKSLPFKPKAEDIFVLGNCWNALSGAPKWGPNILNQPSFEFERFWADVFIFKLSVREKKGFTSDIGDETKFE